MIKKITALTFFSLSFIVNQSYAVDQINVTNNTTAAPAQQQQPQQVVQPCPPANQNNIYDPRIPPAGVYKTQNADGSSSTTYTTGEKKPYIVDNNCNNGTPAAQPYVFVPPPK